MVLGCPLPFLSLIPALVLCCAHLQEPEQGRLSQKCAALLPYGLSSKSHCVLSQCIITNNSWLLSLTIHGWLHSYLSISV